MKKFCAINRKSILSAILMTFICLFCAITLTACNDSNNNKNATVTENDKSLYLFSTSFSEEEGVIYAYVTMNGKEEYKLQSVLHWTSTRYALNTWFNQEDVEMQIDSSEIYREVDGMLTDEMREHDGVTYDLLKVVLRYDTIYKSIKSDASVTKQGRNYMHRFLTDKTQGEQTFTLGLKTQNTANWYTMLIFCVILFSVLLIGVMLALKGNLCQKKKM